MTGIEPAGNFITKSRWFCFHSRAAHTADVAQGGGTQVYK